MAVNKRTKSALEALMYIWGEPLELKDAAEAIGVERSEALEAVKELQAEYDQEGRGLMIRQVGHGYQFATRPEYGEIIEKLCTPVKTRRLSQAALEVLAIVAYKQPVTKSEIDSIRGIKCDRVIEGLMKKELVEERGRTEGIGRPIIYGTTDNFLKQFGFTTLKDLPEIEDIEDVLAMEHFDGEEDFPPDMQMSLEEINPATADAAADAGEPADDPAPTPNDEPADDPAPTPDDEPADAPTDADTPAPANEPADAPAE